MNYENGNEIAGTSLGPGQGIPNCESSQINLRENFENRDLLIILDLLFKKGSKSGLQLHVYDDGSVQKKYIIK